MKIVESGTEASKRPMSVEVILFRTALAPRKAEKRMVSRRQ